MSISMPGNYGQPQILTASASGADNASGASGASSASGAVNLDEVKLPTAETEEQLCAALDQLASQSKVKVNLSDLNMISIKNENNEAIEVITNKTDDEIQGVPVVKDGLSKEQQKTSGWLGDLWDAASFILPGRGLGSILNFLYSLPAGKGSTVREQREAMDEILANTEM